MSLAGTRLGHYELVSILGAGGMGDVYRARDTRLRRDVAIKVLPAAFTSDPDRLARFEREARALAALNHPHIAAIYGVEETTGVRALVLELIEGETLGDRIARGLKVREAVAIAQQIVAALDAAHEKGVVHRDLKPSNIMIATGGAVKVLDFGLAKLDGPAGLTDLSQSPTITQSATNDGLVSGTAPYMSPEQSRGQFVDKRTDIWAFGCVLYEMLTGHRAFGRDTYSDTIAAILEHSPDWVALPADTPAVVRRLLERCLEKDPRRRIRDIGDVQLDLEDTEREPSTTSTTDASAHTRQFGWPLAVTAVTAAILAVVAARPLWTTVSHAPEFSRVTQLFHGSSFEYGPSISPDGKWIAYLSNARGPTDIWVRFLSGGDPVNLTASTTLEIQSRVDLGGLAISPDGESIAFDAGATKGTPAAQFDAWVIPAPLGGAPRKVVELGRALRWSPDGSQIAFVRPGSSAGDSLWVARSDGGSPREVVALRGGMHVHWPVWSHDGRHIYFNYSISTANREPASIYRVPAAGGPVESVVVSPRRAVFSFPTRDGRGVVYAANPNSVDLALWWRPVDGGDATRLTTGVGEYAEPSITSDGRTMISSLVQFQQTLMVFTMNAGALPPQPITDGTTRDIDPMVSPNGQQLVFSSSRSGFQNLWTARPDGLMPRALTSGNAFDERPAFSPDGRRLAFVSDRGGRRSIWTMAADGGIPERLVDADVVDHLVWSPDGRRIVFAVAGSNAPALQSVRVADGVVEPFRTPGPATTPFGFVGDTLGYLEPFPGDAGRPNVNRVAFVGSNGESASTEAMRSVNVANGFAALSPDGRRVAAMVEPGGAAGSIWILDLMRGTPFQKVTDLPADIRFRGAAWADNDRLIVGTVQRTSHLVLFDQAK
jgi:eukaryotic-like serine/threonine-protein kinase